MSADNKNDVESQLNNAIDKLLAGIDFSELDRYLQEVQMGEATFFDRVKSFISSGNSVSIEEISEKILDLIFGNIVGILPYLGTILAIVIALAVIESLNSQSFDKSLTSLCNFIGVGVIIGVIGALFITEYQECLKTTQILTGQIQTVFPIMMTLMAAVGGGKTVAIFKPSVAYICQGLSLLSTKVLLPLVCLIIIFSCINSFSDGVKLEKAADFCKSTFKWIIGISSVIFCFFITAQSVSVSAFDSVSIKALRFAMGNSLPLLGSLFSNGFDAVIASCILVKSAVGGIMLILILITAFAPVIKIVCINLLLKLIAAIAEPIANSSTVKLLSGLSDGFSYLSTVIATIGIVYMISVLLAMCTLGVSI